MSSIGNTIKTVILWALERVNTALGWIDDKIKNIRILIGVQASEKARAAGNASDATDFMTRGSFPGVNREL